MHNQGLVTLHLKKDYQLCGVRTVRQIGVFIAFGMRVQDSELQEV